MYRLMSGRGWLVAGLISCWGLADRAGAQSGGLTVRVVDAAGQGPIESAQVSAIGTTIGGVTSGDGRVTLRLGAGSYNIRVLRVGYAEQKKSVTVPMGQTVSLDFVLQSVAVNLAPVVTTATGEARRVEVGNTVANISAAALTESAPIRDVNDLLNSRAPGISVSTGSQTGGGARIRIRGTSSLSLSNDPIFVIDGVRMTSNPNSSNLFTGGAQPSRIGDLNPDEIENLEIVKGPSAATLYGTDAANGVIVITTKRGRAGAARWTYYGEGGALADRNTYPTNYTMFGKRAGQSVTAPLNFCNNSRLSRAECTLDSVATFNLFDDAETTPFGTGYRSQFGTQVSGGTELVRYFASAEREQEVGVLSLPEFERERFRAQNRTLREWTDRPNALTRNSFRANLNAAPSSALDLALSTAYFNVAQRFSIESNGTVGIGSQAFGGPGFRTNGNVAGLGTPLNGYRAWTPAYSWEEKTGQGVNRVLFALNSNWRPTSWLSSRANIGTDFTSRVDDNLLYRGEGAPVTGTYRDGFKENTRTNLRNLSVDAATTAAWNPRPSIAAKSTVGVQYVDYRFELGATGANDLPPGASTSGSGAFPTATEATTVQRTLGAFLEQSIAYNDRMFLTLAVRTDQNSAFGTNFQRVFYPKAALSWVLSEESFFPRASWLDEVRLRSAFGASGVQPGPNDAQRTFAAAIGNVKGTDVPALIADEIGNADLRPERSTEFEGGLDLKLFRSRVSIEGTYYRKQTRDAIISAIVPPSLGSNTRVRQNFGAVRNEGAELAISGQLVDRRALGIDLAFSGSINENELLDAGGVPPQITVDRRVTVGYPLFGFWQRPILGYQDKNKDGLLTYNADRTLSEVVVGDSSVYRGYVQAPRIMSLTTGLELFQRKLRLSGVLDHRGGHLIYNNTERIRCVSRQNCNGLMNPKASFDEQAAAVVARDHPSRSIDGFFEDGDFLRLREVSAQLTLPSSWATRIGMRNATLVASARNLKVWTAYRGVDPENDFQAGANNEAAQDFQTLGPASYLVVRINLSR